MRFASRILCSWLFCALPALLLSPAPAHAAPSPGNSSHDPCFVVCPLGDITYHVTVRDIANLPVAGSNVTLDFSHCAFVHCPIQPPSIIVNDAAKTMSSIANGSGVASFPLAMGGCCDSVVIYADGVQLAKVSMASTDQNADLVVNGTDAILMNSFLGTVNTCADLDCTGAVTLADLTIEIQHNGHSCTGVVPAQSRTWGTLKTIYR